MNRHASRSGEVAARMGARPDGRFQKETMAERERMHPQRHEALPV
jgi:hypothetical protein